ncbi:hypothetical protein LG018_004820 [Salmonella enterica subsp. enterica serovar Kottbus]|nr:hypothetical protein [Salmonella enterica subsp. enterica serovar Kottbus]
MARSIYNGWNRDVGGVCRVLTLPLGLTIEDVRGYIPCTPAKSGVGIGLPDIETVHNRAGGFFMR